MINFLKRCFPYALNISALIFTIVPEDIFKKYCLLAQYSDYTNIILNRIITIIVIFIVYGILLRIKWWKIIKYHNYSVQVEYGDIFKKKNCKKIIAFDECFTTDIGEDAPYIKQDSICGQFLQNHAADSVLAKIADSELQPLDDKSMFKNKARYEPGRLVVYDTEFLLMPFAKLDKSGLGCMPSRKDYLNCLDLMWKEIDKSYGTTDVCVTVLGSGRTRMYDESLTSQDLLEIMIWSYMLSGHKIKPPYKLRIVCKRDSGVSINDIAF